MKIRLILLLLASIQLASAAAPAAIAPTFFGIDENAVRSPWPPTTASGAKAPAAALRLWDDGVKWTNLETCDPAGVSGVAPTDPNNSCYTWTNLDTWVRSKAPAAGMDVLYTLGGTPGFATSQIAPRVACETAGIYSCLPPLDVDMAPNSGLGDGTDATWIDFLTVLVTRYKGQIQFYELWNEPDSSNFFTGTNAQFIRMMNDAAATIRAIDPAARILSPSFHGPTAATWFATFLSAGGAADFDIVNFHGRGSGDANIQPEAILTTYAQAEPVITAHGLSSLPFWDDEAGWLQNQVLDPDMQAAYVARSYILRASLGLARFYWYQWDSAAPYGLQGTIAGNAYAQVAGWLTGSVVSPCAKTGAVYSCPITLAGGSQATILWDSSQSCSAGVCSTAPAMVGGAPVALGAKPILLQSTEPPSPPSIAITAVVNAASNLSGAISPGEIVTIYGFGLDGATVTVNSISAPVLYTSATQVAAVVPYATSGSSAQIAVSAQGQTPMPLSVPVTPSNPGLFTADSSGQGQAAALNQDGSYNSPTSPAQAGDAVVLFATGAGQTTPPGVDGAPAMPPYPQPVLPVRVAVGGQQAQVDYAGAAPGEIAGLLQINIRIPSGIPASRAVPVVVQIGTARSQTGATLAVQ